MDNEADTTVALLVTTGRDPVHAATLDAIASVFGEVVVVRLDRVEPTDLVSKVQGRLVALVDDRCTGISTSLISEALHKAADHPVVFVQPALETLKLVRSGRVVRTVDREQVRVVSTPAVLPGEVLAELPDLTAALRDPAVLVCELRRLGPLELLEAPPHVRRVSPDETSVG